MGLLDAFFDDRFRKDMARGLLDAGNRGAVAGLLGGPVDLATMALRPLGYNVEQPVGGSEWIGQKMQNLGLVSEKRNPLAEALASFAGPMAAQQIAPRVFAAELRAMDNMAKPSPMNAATRGQAGAVVWHGSPHKFDKFDSSKIGTGEGSQAYGHGLYLADKPEVSRQYAAIASKPGLRQGSAIGTDDAVLDAIIKLNARKYANGDVTKFGEVVQANPQAFSNPDKMLARIAEFVDNSPPGYIYKVDLPDDQMARMLDWDKPLSQQAPEVQKGLAALDPDMYGPKGGDYDPMELGQMIYQRLMNQGRDYAITAGKNAQTTLGASQAKAAEDLRAFGIPGIRYLDGGSRGAGQGSSNYVVFPGNEGLLSILERNGMPLK